MPVLLPPNPQPPLLVPEGQAEGVMQEEALGQKVEDIVEIVVGVTP